MRLPSLVTFGATPLLWRRQWGKWLVVYPLRLTMLRHPLSEQAGCTSGTSAKVALLPAVWWGSGTGDGCASGRALCLDPVSASWEVARGLYPCFNHSLTSEFILILALKAFADTLTSCSKGKHSQDAMLVGLQTSVGEALHLLGEPPFQ